MKSHPIPVLENPIRIKKRWGFCQTWDNSGFFEKMGGEDPKIGKNGGFLSHGGTPSHHPFRTMGFSHGNFYHLASLGYPHGHDPNMNEHHPERIANKLSHPIKLVGFSERLEGTLTPPKNSKLRWARIKWRICPPVFVFSDPPIGMMVNDKSSGLLSYGHESCFYHLTVKWFVYEKK